MKKFFTVAALIAAGSISLTMAGCNNEDKDNEQNTVETETTLSGEETDKLFNIGKTEDNIYTNDFFNFKYTGNDNWRILNEDQLATISSSIKDVLSNEDSKEAIESGKTSIIMYAVSKDASENVSVTVEKHNINNTQDADMDSFLDKSVESLTQSLPTQGFKDVSVAKEDITFCGEPARGIKINAKYDVKAGEGSDKTEEKQIYETMVYMFRGSYSSCVTSSSFDEDKTQEVLNMFSKAE